MVINIIAVFWLILSEIFPSSIKGRAAAFIGAVNWAINMLISFTFLDYLGGCDIYIVFMDIAGQIKTLHLSCSPLNNYCVCRKTSSWVSACELAMYCKLVYIKQGNASFCFSCIVTMLVELSSHSKHNSRTME